MYSTLSHPITSAIDIAHTLSTATVSLATDVIVSTGGKVATNSVVAGLLENGLIRVMEKQIKYGRLTLILLSSKSYTFGPVASPSSAKEVSATTRIDTRLSSTSLASSSFLSSTANTAPHSPHPADSHFSTPGTTLPSSSPRPNFKNLPEEEEVQPNITVKVLSNTFFLRLLLSGDLGFAEAYMAGECLISYTTDDDGSKGSQELDEGYYGSDVWEGEKGEREGEVLLDLFKIAIRSDHPSASSSLSSSKQSRASGSRGITGGLDSLPKSIFQTFARYTSSNKIINSVRNSVGNIRAHYDISNRMFASFLSPDMTYSCAIFPELDGDLTPTLASSTSLNPIYRPNSYPSPPSPSSSTDPLETAQYAKLDHIIHKAKIPPGARVLEIGSGWGSMAIRCVQLTGCTVDTLTLSTQQKVLAEERIKKAGLEGSITVHLMDFRSIPESWYHTFDRVVSIEMLEAVGKEYIQPYFKMIDDVLNEKGVAVFQVITIPEARFENYAANVDFIQKWSESCIRNQGVFPGGFLPSVAYTTEMISKGSRNRLGIDSIVNIGPHYARTLREWRIRFLKNFDRDIRPALKDEHPEMSEADVEVFKRKWIYYFVYCEIGFAERMIGDHIFSISREGNRSFGSDIYA